MTLGREFIHRFYICRRRWSRWENVPGERRLRGQFTRNRWTQQLENNIKTNSDRHRRWELFSISRRSRGSCLNEFQKKYCIKTKLIALDWQWVTLRSWTWCQMNHNCPSSSVENKIEGKTYKSFEKLLITSKKSTLDIFVKYFLITCVHILISLQ